MSNISANKFQSDAGSLTFGDDGIAAILKVPSTVTGAALSICVGDTEKLSVSAAGDIVAASATVAGDVEVTTVGSSFILKSPDGTRYKLAVANDGTLTATAA